MADNPETTPDPKPDPKPDTPPPANKDGEQHQPSAADLAASLGEERRARKQAERELAALKEKSMSDTEKAIAKAKAEGKAEAVREAGKRLAVAEFRAAASGKIDAAAALEVIDLSRFVDDDGEPDTKAIANVVDRLAAALPTPSGNGTPKIPAGPREQASDGDFLRQQLNASRG